MQLWPEEFDTYSFRGKFTFGHPQKGKRRWIISTCKPVLKVAKQTNKKIHII